MLSLRRTGTATGLLLGFAFLMALLAAPAGAAEIAAPPSHNFLFSLEGFVKEPGQIPVPPPEGEFEDACGVAVDAFGDLYISDYYHHTIDIYDSSRTYLTQIKDPDPDGPCNLAIDAEGHLYVNHWRRNVVRFTPSSFPPTASTTYGPATTIDFPSSPGARSTGLALDPATGELYVDDRTYVAVYEVAQLSQVEPEPARTVGLGTIGQGYGVAVSDFGATVGDVYVPDATTDTVKVFGPAGEALAPIDGAGTPQRGFNSLADSNVAIDQGDGQVYVADNLEPGFETPKAVFDELNPAGEYRGRLQGSFTDAEPSALVVDEASNVYVSSGNSEKAKIVAFGPTVAAHSLKVAKSGAGEGTVSSEPAGIDCGGACAAEYNAGSEVILSAEPAPGSAFAGWSGACSGTAPCHLVLAADSEVTAEFKPLPPQPISLEATGPAKGATSGAPAPATTASVLGPPALHSRTGHHRHHHRYKGRGLKAKRGRH
jgi:DNA-binding beta-propeller fold protein YncE